MFLGALTQAVIGRPFGALAFGGGVVGAPNEAQHLAGKLAQFRAHRVFMIPAEIVYDLFKIQREDVTFLPIGRCSYGAMIIQREN